MTTGEGKMFRPIRTLLYVASLVLLLVGFVAFMIGMDTGTWWMAFIVWGLSAIAGWLGRKCPL